MTEPVRQSGGVGFHGYALWLDPVGRPGWQNMALDAALLERADAGERWLRLYAWDPPCLSFGRHEPADRRYDADRLAALGLDLVRRPTGGRAVWHDRELTYALVAPVADFGTVRHAYLEIHAVLRLALSTLGAATALAGAAPPGNVHAGACFSRPVGGELVAGDGKVVGSAQLRSVTGFLQHGSVLLGGDQAIVGRATRGDAPPDRALSLATLLGRPVGWAELAGAIADAARASWGEPASLDPDPRCVLARAEALADRFGSTAWTWTATPATAAPTC